MKNINWSEIQSTIEFSTDIQIRFSDIDGYYHVNNGIYFNYFEHARAVFLYEVCHWDIMSVGTVVARIEIDYMTPIHLEDQIQAFVHCTRTGNSSFDLFQYLIGNRKDGTTHVFASCKCTMVSVDIKTMKPIPIPSEYLVKMLPKT